MPGSFILRPVEANLTHNTELIGKMSPYCTFVHGDTKINTQIAKKGGKHPQWNETVVINSNELAEPKILVEILDKDHITSDDLIGVCRINLNELSAGPKSSKWYPVFYKHKPAGELLIESVYQPELLSTEGIKTEASLYSENLLTTEELGVIAQSEKVVINEPVAAKVFTEQHQIVEPHVFMKEVEVVETVPVLKEIEVMEARKVVREVEYTEAVPVMKQIEVVEPQVVMKEIEVIEPRVVTKTIQVIENVPVKRQVEVIEMRTHIKEVETFEPQTFKKTIEIIEHFPVMKTVQVSEPVTVQKTVEFVEPIITTQTITKEVFEPVVVGEKITTTVGPATLLTTEVEKKVFGDNIIIETRTGDIIAESTLKTNTL